MIHKYLAYLKTIETGSITQAAAELGYTQSAVSRMIADLEEHWDVPLLTRNRSGIEISSEGTQLLPILQSIVKGQEELSFAVGELHGLQSGLIRVGAFTSMATGWMPLMIKSFHEKYPNIRFQIFNGEYNQIATWLRRGQIDCGFLALPCAKEFDTTFLLRDSLTVILPPNRCATRNASPSAGCRTRISSASRRSRTTRSTSFSNISGSPRASSLRSAATSPSLRWSSAGWASAWCTT